ncbi:glutaredoxin family protein [Arthrobacter psychrolactophilus]
MEPAANAPDAHRDDPAVELPVDGATGPLLELVTRSGCHLCEAARTVVTDVAAELGLGWSEVSIDNDAELTARYGEEIPVVLVDGIQRDFWQIDPVRLRTILSKALAGN